MAVSGTSSVPGMNSPVLYMLTNGTDKWTKEIVPGAGTSSFAASLAVTQTDTTVAIEGPGNTLDIYQAANGSRTWSETTVACPGTTFSTPSLVANDSGYNIAVAGPSGSLDFYWSTDGTSWTPVNIATKGNIYSAPSVADNGTLESGTTTIAAQGPGNTLDIYQSANGSGTWSETTVACPGTTFSTPSLVATDSGYNIAVAGPSGSLDFYWSTDGTSWTPVNIATKGNIYSAPSVADNGTLESGTTTIAAQGPGNTLDIYQAANGSGTWSETTVAGPGTTFSTPSLVATDSGYNIAVAGPSGSLLLYEAAAGTSAWKREQVAPSGSVGQISDSPMNA